MFVLVKVPTPVRISGTTLLEGFHYQSFSLSRTIVDIYSDNVWESRQCVILHSHLIKWLESTAINLICIFALSATYVFVFKNKPKWSSLHYTQSSKMKCVMECPPLSGQFVSFKHRDWQRESKQLLPAKKIRWAACFSFHVCRYTKEMIMSHISLLLKKKNYLGIINDYFRNLHQNKWICLITYVVLFYGK